jgi:hypothetical protein
MSAKEISRKLAVRIWAVVKYAIRRNLEGKLVYTPFNHRYGGKS